MMKGKQILDDSNNNQRESKLHEVFKKISDIWHNQKPKIPSEVADSILPERFSVPSAEGCHGPDEAEAGALAALTRRLEAELRAAKTRLPCGEVLLPAQLLPHAARAVLRAAHDEPCGLRGCLLFLLLDTPAGPRRVATVRCDPSAVPTFELSLTLRQDCRAWHSLLPQFLKNLTKGGTIVISQDFALEKKKLYRSYLE